MEGLLKTIKTKTVAKKKKHPREKVYDEQIYPLMAQILEIAKANDIDLYCEFNIGDGHGEFCNILVANNYPKYQYLYALGMCAEKNGINIDKFLIHLMKNGKNHSSAFLQQLGQKAEYDNASTKQP